MLPNTFRGNLATRAVESVVQRWLLRMDSARLAEWVFENLALRDSVVLEELSRPPKGLGDQGRRELENREVADQNIRRWPEAETPTATAHDLSSARKGPYHGQRTWVGLSETDIRVTE